MSLKDAVNELVDRMFRHADLDDAFGIDDFTKLERGLPLNATTESPLEPDFDENNHSVFALQALASLDDASLADEPASGSSSPFSGSGSEWISKGWTLPEERSAADASTGVKDQTGPDTEASMEDAEDASLSLEHDSFLDGPASVALRTVGPAGGPEDDSSEDDSSRYEIEDYEFSADFEKEPETEPATLPAAGNDEDVRRLQAPLENQAPPTHADPFEGLDFSEEWPSGETPIATEGLTEAGLRPPAMPTEEITS